VFSQYTNPLRTRLSNYVFRFEYSQLVAEMLVTAGKLRLRNLVRTPLQSALVSIRL
jgi:hypothetical protein